MHIHDIQSSPQHPEQNFQINQKYLALQKNLNYYLEHYQLQSVEQMIDIILNPQLSQQFKEKFPQFDSAQKKEFQISQKLKKLAVQHTYHEMYIYYQQFPMYLEECKKVLRHKYKFDDILRTHQNRKSIWLLCSGALFKMRENPSFYQKITQNRPQYPQFFKHTIEKDVVRTVSDKNSKQLQNSLSSVLRNFAIKNPYIGYCQGMNFIVNFLLLMQFTQQEAFWITTQLLEQFLPKTYYTNMMGVAVDIHIIEQYIKSYYPQLYNKLHEMNLNLSLFTLESIVCLFTSTLPFYMLVIVWDMFFMNGPSILLKVCLVILAELEETILNTEDLSQLLVIIESKKKGIFIEEDRFIKRISSIYIDSNLLELCREIVELKLMMQKVQMNSSINKPKKKPHAVQCNVTWPICFKALKQHKSDMGQIQVWVFKQETPIKPIPNYLTMKNKKSLKTIQDQKSQEKKLIIGRIPHICNFEQYNKQIQKESIELEEYDLLNRRLLVNYLGDWTSKLKQNQNNDHLEFYRRATASKLAFLQLKGSGSNMSLPDPNVKQRKSISPMKKKVKNDVTNSEVYSTSLSKQVTQSKNRTKNCFQTASQQIKIQRHKQNSSSNQYLPQGHHHSTRNPFKKMKQKWDRKHSKNFKEQEK